MWNLQRYFYPLKLPQRLLQSAQRHGSQVAGPQTDLCSLLLLSRNLGRRDTHKCCRKRRMNRSWMYYFSKGVQWMLDSEVAVWGTMETRSLGLWEFWKGECFTDQLVGCWLWEGHHPSVTDAEWLDFRCWDTEVRLVPVSWLSEVQGCHGWCGCHNWTVCLWAELCSLDAFINQSNTFHTGG